MTAPDDPLLKEEYFHLNEIVEDFDQKALTIKAWSVTLSMAGIGVALTQKAAIVLLLAGAASIMFWLTEALWKSFQQAYYPRIRDIEAFYAGKLPTITPFQINASWSRAWHAGRAHTMLRILSWPHVYLPHVVVGLGGPCMWLINLFHPYVPVSTSP
jgi:hypothetical protein